MPTPKELVDRAMRQQRPERIPVMCQMANGHTIINTGAHPIDYFVSDEVWAGCLIRMREPRCWCDALGAIASSDSQKA